MSEEAVTDLHGTYHRRLDVGLIEPAGSALDRLCARTGHCVADVVNRAIVLYDEWDHTERSGGTWAVVGRDGHMESVRMVPNPPDEGEGA